MKPFLLIVAVVTAGSGLWFVTAGRSDPPAQAPAASGQVITVTRRDIGATVLATGVIRPQVGAEVRVGSRVSGVLERLYVTDGDQVRRGQLLAQLDSAEFAARYAQAVANLENARAESTYAAGEFTRAEHSFRREVITEAEFAQARRMRDVRISMVRQAQAELASARIQLGYTNIVAPIGGVVATVSTQVGETIAASLAAPTFVTIVDLDRLEVWAYVDETDIGRVAVGQATLFTVDTYPDTEFDGTVTAIRPTAEIQDNVVNYITVIEIAGGHGRTLRPEMTATVNIMLERRENVLAVPNGAVRRDREGAYVFVLRHEERARQPIRTGYRGRDYTEVLEGLDEHDRIIAGSTAR
ncbi:MAG TPA: efflux RND transporter periplasmic adaptor subunit [Gemmatimonadales bacterium]